MKLYTSRIDLCMCHHWFHCKCFHLIFSRSSFKWGSECCWTFHFANPYVSWPQNYNSQHSLRNLWDRQVKCRTTLIPTSKCQNTQHPERISALSLDLKLILCAASITNSIQYFENQGLANRGLVKFFAGWHVAQLHPEHIHQLTRWTWLVIQTRIITMFSQSKILAQ